MTYCIREATEISLRPGGRNSETFFLTLRLESWFHLVVWSLTCLHWVSANPPSISSHRQRESHKQTQTAPPDDEEAVCCSTRPQCGDGRNCPDQLSGPPFPVILLLSTKMPFLRADSTKPRKKVGTTENDVRSQIRNP